MDPQPKADRETPDGVREVYEPPTAEDVDTTYAPSETSAGAGSPTTGAEESERWH